MDITTPAVAATQFAVYVAHGKLVTAYTSTWQAFTLSAYGYRGYPIALALDAGVGLIAIALLPCSSACGARSPTASRRRRDSIEASAFG